MNSANLSGKQHCSYYAHYTGDNAGHCQKRCQKKLDLQAQAHYPDQCALDAMYDVIRIRVRVKARVKVRVGGKARVKFRVRVRTRVWFG